jgi:pimeloyl-ACP methyl ester carboxylesterase
LSLLLALAACERPPGPRAQPAEIAALARARLPARKDGPAQGISLSYLEAGDPNGRRVIFVHGTPGDARGWADFLRACPPGVHCIAVDRPGFGETTPLQPVASLLIQAEAIAPLATVVNGQRAVLVGHSLGAPIVTQLAINHTDKVGGLMLLAGAMDPDLERVLWVQRVGAWRPVASILPRMLRTTNEELMPLKSELQVLAPHLGELHLPVAILHGTKDPLVPFENVTFDYQMLTGAKLSIDAVEDQNHFLPWNETARVQAALARLLREAQ